MGVFPGFVGPTYESASLDADAQRALNLYPELVESGTGMNKYVYCGAPGKHTFCTLATSPVRGLWAGANRLFAAAGTKVYEVFSDGTSTELGTIADDASHSPVEMFPNGNQLLTVSAGSVYCDSGSGPVVVNFTGGSTPVTASTGAFLDGFFIVGKPSTKTFYISNLNDGSLWDPLDFASKEGYPDAISSIFADHEELWLFGAETTEAWRNEGNLDFPFQRDPGAFNHMGIAAPYSRVRLDGNLCWLAADARGKIFAVRAQGFLPKRISTHAIEAKWEAYSTVADAIAYAYYENGHNFWVITFPTADKTWCYDATTELWHERAWWSGSALARDRGRCHAYVFGKHFVGDHTNGKIYQQSNTFYDDFGGDRQYIRTAPYIYQEEKRVYHHALQLDLETGGGSLTASIDVSDDHGHNYNTARTVTALSTEYNRRMRLRRLGESRHRIYRSTFTTQQKMAIVNAFLELSVGLH